VLARPWLVPAVRADGAGTVCR